jgi:glycosyltransferase involved in cell wall biosynthesis
MSLPEFNCEKKILFIGHAASRSGAPILLLHLLRWLKQNSRIQFEILLKTGGPLESDFAALAPTTVLELSRWESFPAKIFTRLGWKIPARFTLPAKVVELARRRQIGFIYANTVAVSEEVAALARLGLPMVWHIHEMPFAIRTFGEVEAFQSASRFDCAYIAASEGVQQGLTADFAVPVPKIKVIHEFIQPEAVAAVARATQRESLRKELALPPDAFVAGMCGVIEWRKGGDWFITVAKHLATEFPRQQIYLVWIGAPDSELTRAQVDHDLRLAGLAERVRFVGGQTDSQRYLAALDAFVLSSREDPFPLAMLEAAALALPIVCFNRSGGGPEFVGSDAGIVVEYADTLAMARALVLLFEQPALREQLGAVARKKVLDHYTVETQAPKILQHLGAVAQNHSARPAS